MIVSCGTTAIRARIAAGSALRSVDAVEPHLARLRVVEALGELEDRRFARARGPTTARVSPGATFRLNSCSALTSWRVG